MAYYNSNDGLYYTDESYTELFNGIDGAYHYTNGVQDSVDYGWSGGLFYNNWSPAYGMIDGNSTFLDDRGSGTYSNNLYINGVDAGIPHGTHTSDSHTFDKTTVSIVKGGVTLTVTLPQLDIAGAGML